jgi:hypothetical protein
VPESTVSELHALYHEAARAEPGPLLDKSILDAVHAELRADRGGKPVRRLPWWKSWLPATSAIAAVLIGLSVTWRVMDEQERRLREEMLPAQTPALTPRSATPDAGPAAAGSMAPLVADEAVKKSRRIEKSEAGGNRDAKAGSETVAGPARQAGKLEAGGLGAASRSEAASDALAKPSADPGAKALASPIGASLLDAATPEAWLQQIRELRAAGRKAEAAQSLARFRTRYPDFVLPADLRDRQ